ncbi:Dihydroxyacetone kinase 2 [Pleurotus pulmonarius]|nr:Dihydroxyacetone kinase 2 [Pleurotus pulmonarius]
MSIQNKHFFNTPETLVIDSLKGLCTVNPKIALDEANKGRESPLLRCLDRSKVALLCGGGSGHEPAHAGYVGEGMLTAAVCGNIFASPNASQVRRGIDLVDNDKGNYTGDILNFGLAKEQYAALHPDKANQVRFVIVGDDVAVGKTQAKIVGRRGLAGTVLVYKIAGALAERGGSLDEVYKYAQWVADHTVSIGVGLEHCHVPGTAPSSSHLSSSEIEIGMGIHNESGHKRVSPVPALSDLVPQLLDFLTSTTDVERSFLPFCPQGGDEVVLLVNNLGGVSELEMGAVVAETRSALAKRNFSVQRVLSGSFMTSLNMPGFSITLLLLPSHGTQASPSAEEVLALLDAPADTPGWKWSSGVAPTETETRPAVPKENQPPFVASARGAIVAADDKTFIETIQRVCHALIAAEPEITQMDVIAGDGDCGLTLKGGAEAVLKKIEDDVINGANVIQDMVVISQIAEEAMGGTSGALYSIFFSALAQGLQSNLPGGHTVAKAWSVSLSSALEKLYTYTRARPPSRTLVDPLAAFIDMLAKEEGGKLPEAIQAGSASAERTRELEAKAGRSAYVEGARLKDQKVPDPGAWGVKVILENLIST